MRIKIKPPAIFWMKWFLSTLILKYRYRKNDIIVHNLSIVKNTILCNFITLYEKSEIYNSLISDFTYIGHRTIIRNTKIGRFCSIGPDCRIGLGKHPINLVSTSPIFYSLNRQLQISFTDKKHFDEIESILIGNDVWIGANVLILDGVKLADGCVVAAGTVVTHDLEAYGVYGGIPAKLIKYRHSEENIESLLKLNWWDKDKYWISKNAKYFLDIEDFINNVRI